MISRIAAPRTSRDLPGRKPRIDKGRESRESVSADAGETQDGETEDGETEDLGRDLVHGDGGTIDLPTKPGDLAKDD